MKTDNAHTGLYGRESESLDRFLREPQESTQRAEDISLRVDRQSTEGDTSEFDSLEKTEKQHENLHQLFQSINPNQNSNRC